MKPNRGSTQVKPATFAGSGLRGFFFAGVTALIVARPLVPSEAVAWLGDGHPFSLLWLLLAAGVSFEAMRHGGFAVRWTLADLAMALLVAVNVLSAALAVRSGSPRPSINMAWEWLALGVSYFLVRILVHGERETRWIVASMVALAVVLSGFGYHQYFAGMADVRERYARDPESALREMGPFYPPGSVERKTLEDRLSSDEPTATFALTNSLAGFLAIWLTVASGVAAFELSRRSGFLSAVGMLASAALIAGCLYLTKSRTAWIAVLLGMGLLALGVLSARRVRRSHVAAAACAFVAIAIGAAAVLHYRDATVFSEAAKSLGYRFEYWGATLSMIREFPWLGVGPGNFQDYYMRFKWPTASEEVSDPHNLFLEVWATAGFLAVIALVGLLASWAWIVFRTPAPSILAERTDPFQNPKHPPEERKSIQPVYPLAGTGLGFALAYLLGGLTGVPLSEDKVLAGVVMAAIATTLLYPWVLDGQISPRVLAIAAIVLVVNLLAAGGIAFPGVAVSLWLCLALSLNLSQDRSAQKSPERSSRLVPALTLAGVAVAAGACYSTAYSPVLNSFSAVERGHQAATHFVREQTLRTAARADPLWARPWEELAHLKLGEWKQQPNREARQDFERAVDRMLELRPQSSTAWRQAGAWQSEVFDKTRDAEDAVKTADYYRRAVELYPASAALHARYALALAAAGRTPSARQEAQEALKLDILTPHRDKKLPENLRDPVARLVEGR